LDLNPLTFDWIKRKASKIYQGMNDVIAGTSPAIHQQGRQRCLTNKDKTTSITSTLKQTLRQSGSIVIQQKRETSYVRVIS